MIRLGKRPREKLGITYFGLLGHEIAVLKSTMESASHLADDYELREPNRAGVCGIVLVNKDSRLATSWWNTYKKQHPSAVPLFLTDSKQDPDENTFCKRPFSPSFVREAFQGVISASAV